MFVILQAIVAGGWAGAVSLMLFLLYGLYEQELHPVTAAAYSSLSHSLWALGLAWVVIACSTGYGGRGYKKIIILSFHLSILYQFLITS